ncbi:MAG: response regulator [Spirochaetes bacterium]|nr:response regulator [Spirochaetota bacterium]MBU1082242.1 response regulator [Spirochaetota bacterium]
MSATFANVWLTRGALLAASVFAYCAWLAYSLDRKSAANRIAVVFNSVFALWAFVASFWYGTDDPSLAMALYRAFSWTWSVFPPLILHFTFRITSCELPGGKWRLPFLALLYAPAAVFSYLVPAYVLADPVYRGGYWMFDVHGNAAYFLFVAHYFGLILASVVIAFARGARSSDPRARKRLRILGWSYLSAVLLGFITDTVCLYAGLDVPNLAIFWILILSVGMIVAISRYGFLSKLPADEALKVLESLAEIVMYVDESGRIAWMNASAIEGLGAPSLELARGRACGDFLPADIVGLASGSGEAARGSEGYRTSLGPEAIPVRLWIHPVKGGGSGGAVLTAVDLRPELRQQRMERSLSDAGLLLDEFVSRSLDGIVLTDTDGHIARWNYPMVAMTGIEASEAVGELYWNLMATLENGGRRDAARFRMSIVDILAGRVSNRNRRILDFYIRGRDGQARVVQSDTFAIPLAEGTILATIARDVTADRRLAKENIERIRKLDHAQKMEAVGTLSGGIAHDFNNTLAGIFGAVSMIRLGLEAESGESRADIAKELDMIERSAQRAASSVRRLLTLTRKRAPRNAAFRLDDALRRVVEFAERSVEQSVRIELQPDLPAANVIGDAGQAEQMLLNLIINAEHAMTSMRPKSQARGGTIALGVSGFRPDKAYLAANPDVADAEYWAVTVRDEGVGIPRHIQNRIFDPFYTTKPEESSNGLGLAMVHAIARQHGGFVDLRSEPGAGAEFIVCLPAIPEGGDSARLERRLGAGAGPVLVADDDDIPRETAVALLKALGYSPTVATGGLEALALFTERTDEWKAVVLDVRMGDQDGRAIALRMRELRPDLPVVLASGLHGEESAGSDGEGRSFALLDKPYTIDELARALEDALGDLRA